MPTKLKLGFILLDFAGCSTRPVDKKKQGPVAATAAPADWGTQNHNIHLPPRPARMIRCLLDPLDDRVR